MIKILVIEDEMIIGAKISMLLTDLGYEVTGLLPRAEEAFYHLQEYTPDIVLLDIQLKGQMDGIELARVLQQDHHIPVVFLTANSDDATFQRAKATQPYAFLEKPFKKIDLQRAIELTISLMGTTNSASKVQDKQVDQEVLQVLKDRIFVRDREKMVKLLLNEILYLKAERNYCRIITATKEYILSMPMKSLEKQLPSPLFQRIHRSYMVNIQHVEEINDSSILVQDHTLLLSKSFKKELLARIKSI